ncbi:hypothetical protein LSH36_162g04053 [Paralvinella palmiformis]|uniref:Uncharacterized protein n=1 Tax=Paralvinella palmiformis TaxID=53620 RepID=A0AAD9JTR6_9ANNE|nr:hypothetical protein LSH36_162g04053 [Paralvinella palmiformis]
MDTRSVHGIGFRSPDEVGEGFVRAEATDEGAPTNDEDTELVRRQVAHSDDENVVNGYGQRCGTRSPQSVVSREDSSEKRFGNGWSYQLNNGSRKGRGTEPGIKVDDESPRTAYREYPESIVGGQERGTERGTAISGSGGRLTGVSGKYTNDHLPSPHEYSSISPRSGDPELSNSSVVRRPVDGYNGVRSSSRRFGSNRQSSERARFRSKCSSANDGTGAVRHYTTLRSRDEDGRIKYDCACGRWTPSGASGIFSGVGGLMSARFIYESDPFEGALRRCPKVTFGVVERATSPISIEILFGNPQKQTLPSYYYVKAEPRPGATPRRDPSGSGSRTSRSNSSQSSYFNDRNLPVLDLPRVPPQPSPLEVSRREISDFIPEENEEDVIRPNPGVRTTKSRSAKSRFVNYKQRTNSATKRSPTSASASTVRSFGLPGKPMKSLQ